MKRPGITALVFLMALATGATLLAQVAPADNIPNWSVPATWSPSAHSGGIQTMTDVTDPRLFVGVSPCRIADTRAGQGFGGQAGPPALTSFMNRNFQITGSPGVLPAPPAGCAAGTIPTGAEAVSLQFTVVFPTSSGNLIAWQAGAVTPNVSVINWDTGTVALGSGTIVPLSAGGAITVRLNTAAAGQGAELVIDVNGYFSRLLETPSNYLRLDNNSLSYTARFTNASTTCSGACGLYQTVVSGWAIYANSTETTADVNYGVYGEVNSTGTGSAGVIGVADNAAGETYGVFGRNDSATLDSAGVTGQSGASSAYNLGNWSHTGVRGHSNVRGILGLTTSTSTGLGGVEGFKISGTTGLIDTGSYLGYSTTVGLHTIGTTSATGAKGFVEPHPTDSSKMIRYISLEGPEAGTYFRGRSKLERGTARIEVPEDFRMVTDSEGLTVQITPIGAMATVAVLRMDLNEIVVQGSRNVEFSYLVQGVRRSYRDVQPIMDNEAFVPVSAEFRMPNGYAPEQKRLLIQNGTYLPDGTVNMETAHRLGWDRIWERDRTTPPTPQPE